MLRLAEQNDWVIWCFVGALVVYAVATRLLNKGGSLLDYLRTPAEDAENTGINWFLTSICFILMLSVLMSQYVPIVPHVFNRDFHLFNYEL
ncbi:MAG: DUF4271 domain-containing protein, partial [Chryseobacterium sp.]